ncbi:ubiquitin-like protein 7b isoform X1 [Ictalurus punctatus]|uniref:Ubiquitin-like protein 7 n=2 Tax=Ictalurus TaxID=7997 RepID=W5UF30_ICTPU|nr:ubiquitin-like protein 7b isoform X1 [Ictalurus punctatus]XP_053478595.1 ubiquitin-like protein 7b isoform X1 [Ictalurus furcatus]ADO27895.1 ubiquitin-like protein 7 [Ictalurus furcatus]
MENTFWHLSLKLHDRPKSVLPFPEDVEPGRYMVATIKQLVSAQLPDSLPDPELIELVHCGCKLKDDLTLDAYGIKSGSTLHILKKVWPEPEVKPEPVNRSAAAREFRLLQATMHSNIAYRDAVFKMLSNKESLDQIIVASPGLSSDPVALGVLQDKDLFVQFTDPNLLDVLVRSHPALVNAIILILHSVTSSMPGQSNASSSHNTPASSYSEMPGGFLFEGMSDDEDDFQSGSRAGSSQRPRPPTNLSGGGATGPRPITQSELATALALANTPESSAATPILGSQQDVSTGSSSAAAGTPVTSSVLSRALQQALEASGVTPLQGRWQTQMQQLRDMGIRDEDLALRALQATDGDLQAALELIFAGGGGL